MPSRFFLELAALLVVVILCIALVQAWQGDRRDRAQLAAELAATKQQLAAADARQHDRDAQLAQTLAALANEKRTVTTPVQIVPQLQKELNLPLPITLETHSVSPNKTDASSDASNKPDAPKAIIPAEDLKPLYDFTLDCKACQAKLAATQSDFTDERAKTTALAKERDDALRIAKGGSMWRRMRHAGKWFLIGAGAGAIAAKATH